MLANTVLVTLICTGSVTSRPNPDLPIVFPDTETTNNYTRSYYPRIFTKSRRQPESETGRRNTTVSQHPRYPPIGPEIKEDSPLCSDPKSTFCENVPYYPINEIRQSIPYTRDQFTEIFGPVELHYREKVTDEDLSEERICGRKTQFFYPKAGKSEDNKWVYVVNDVDYVQAVVAEVCENENKPCFYVDKNLPAAFESKCRQLYAYKRLLALEPSDKKSQIASFRFPSCCVCYIKYPIGWTHSRKKSNHNNEESIAT